MTFYIVFGICFAVCIAVVIKRLCKCKRPLAMAALSALSGAASLLAVNVVSTLTGVQIALDYVTSAVCVVLGIPGVLLLLLIKISDTVL